MAEGRPFLGWPGHADRDACTEPDYEMVDGVHYCRTCGWWKGAHGSPGEVRNIRGALQAAEGNLTKLSEAIREHRERCTRGPFTAESAINESNRPLWDTHREVTGEGEDGG